MVYYTNDTITRRSSGAKGKQPPQGWEPCEPELNEHTGHWPGWVPVGDGPEDKWHREAFRDWPDLANGTYELVGPKVQGNPYNLEFHELWGHGFMSATQAPRTFEGIREYLTMHNMEGIVWHHPDGRMCKIKSRDFGIKWPREMNDATS